MHLWHRNGRSRWFIFWMDIDRFPFGLLCSLVIFFMADSLVISISRFHPLLFYRSFLSGHLTWPLSPMCIQEPPQRLKLNLHKLVASTLQPQIMALKGKVFGSTGEQHLLCELVCNATETTQSNWVQCTRAYQK